ncbi:hypothetical protein ABZZ79_08750 [Streptomyces sp. NPDC006458]|uniref:hypothetical protein n=1 Tax=Streptomyces sp. NPDC006458 TaxID=3154302 RepID=UPI0033BC32AE
MKHRGRHRRRRRGRALRAFLTGTALALTGAATMISVSQATVDEDPGALKTLAADGSARLTEDLVPSRALDRLTREMGHPVGIGTLLARTDHTLRPADSCTTAERAALPVAPTATRAHCWDPADTDARRPGAVTTSADADDDGAWGTHRVVLAGWSTTTAGTDTGNRTDTANGTDTGGGTDASARAERPALARVSFVDADPSHHPAYTSALLVVPVDDGRDYRPLASDLSGMVWYEDKLLVTADDAVYVYDMHRILRTTVSAPSAGRVPGGWSAYGLRYVLPAVGAYRLAPGAPRPGALSLDRSTAPDSLVLTQRAAGDGEDGTLLRRYSFSTDPDRSGLLATGAPGATGQADPVETLGTAANDVRGVLSYRSGWYVSRAGEDGPGSLWRQDTEGARVTECGSDHASRCWSTSTASLSYWARTGEVWTQSGRMLFALPLREIDRALD